MIKLTSGQVAQLTNISKSTLRHYVDKELVTPSVSNENGYHFFTEKDLYMVFQIKMLRTIGFSIEEIRTSFRVDYFGDHFDEIYNRTKDQIDELEAIKDKLLKLKEIKKSITIGKTEVVFCSDRYLKNYQNPIK
ncbi:MerR family transcriptional regulator [Carnobacterium maltaromaticum]|uniref:helix-turn-helix domain-containing protein n=1 Tax=Carnobacterium maltaromaticum TaxID=2751 RepID=UPI0039AFE0AD